MNFCCVSVLQNVAENGCMASKLIQGNHQNSGENDVHKRTSFIGRSGQILSIGDTSGSMFFTHSQMDISDSSISTPVKITESKTFDWRVIAKPRMVMLGLSLMLYVMGSSVVYQCLPPLAHEIGMYTNLLFTTTTALCISQ